MEAPKNIPDSPGIYKMLDKDSKVIYVGKAKNLKKRVSTYFHKDYEHSSRTRHLLKNAVDIQFIETDSELEALILENSLIKELRPRYNILMKDDKSYLYIKIDFNEDFPKIRVVREKDLDKSDFKKQNVKLFGPKLATSKVYETLRILKKLFPFRHCQLDIQWMGEKMQNYENLQIMDASSGRINCLGRPSLGTASSPSMTSPQLGLPDKNLVQVKNRVIDFPCLDYSIKRCPGPCIGAISPVEYKKIVQQVADFLSGKSEDVEASFKKQMQEAAEAKLFEKAARIRDKLFAIQKVTEKQKVSDSTRLDTDVINFTAEAGHVYFNIFMIREGKLINQENFVLDALEVADISKCTVDLSEILESFIGQYYEKSAYLPKEILVSQELEHSQALAEWLSEKRGDKVSIIHPQRGEKNKLLELSLKNAVSFAKQYRIKWMSAQNISAAVGRLAEILNIKDKKIRRIEGFDISHLGGNETVGSMVVFENGLPRNEHYRQFKLRTVSGKPDDYASMEEVLMRRLKYLSKEKLPNEIKIKAPTKKDFEEIKTVIEKNNLFGDKLDKRDFLALKKEKQVVGFGRIVKFSENVHLLASMFIYEKFRGAKLGHKLIEKLIGKCKSNRIYAVTSDDLKEYYSLFGFEELRKPPEILEETFTKLCKSWLKGREMVYLAFDKTKHKIDASFTFKPNLIVIDGGKGQLGTAMLALKRFKLDIPVISLAKQFEEIYVPGEKAPILLEEGDEALKLLQRIRDESHRFAITFQRSLHRKSLLG